MDAGVFPLPVHGPLILPFHEARHSFRYVQQALRILHCEHASLGDFVKMLILVWGAEILHLTSFQVTHTVSGPWTALSTC